MNIRKNRSFLFDIHTFKGTLTILLADVLLTVIIAAFFLESRLLFSQHFYQLIFLLLIIILTALSINQIYFVTESSTPFFLAKKISFSFLITCLSVFTFGYFSSALQGLSWRLIPALVILFSCLFILRYFFFFSFQKNRSKVLILGANELARKILEETQRKHFKPYEIIGLTSTNPKLTNTSFHGARVLGSLDELPAIVKQHRPDCIVVALRNRRGKLPVQTLLNLKTSGVRIIECTTFYEQITQKILVDEFLKPSWFIFEEGFSSSPIHRSIKRIQSFFISLFLLIAFSPLLVLISLAIKLDSSGPVLYLQDRVGQNGKVFRLYKFRSMYHLTEENSQAQFTAKNDPRITRIGKLIRKTRLDETPQLFNVLKGEMDMIGPRPEQTSFVDHLQALIPYYNLRHTVRPGLSGWAQVKYRYGDSFQEAQEKLHYDLFYVKNHSWSLDLFIILLTFREILALKGR